MPDKDKYLLWEILFTLLQLIFLAILLNQVLGLYSLYLIFGLGCGFSFSWFNRGRFISAMNIIINIAVLGAFIGFMYALLYSSFTYRDVVRICIMGVSALAVILSFHASATAFLNYIQALSIPLLMSFPVSTKIDSVSASILTLGYLICWAVILRLKFYGSFALRPAEEKTYLRQRSLIASAVIFFICLGVSWALVLQLPLINIKTGGFLTEEGIDFDISEQEFYDLQDKFQKAVTHMIPGLPSGQGKHEVLLLLSTAIKEWPNTMEVEKAELGLVSHIREPGPGLEKSPEEGVTYTMQRYLDSKPSHVLRKISDSMAEGFRNDLFSIKTKISVLSLANQKPKDSSYKETRKHEARLQKTINDSSLSPVVKAELLDLAQPLEEWKTFGAYRQKTSLLLKEISELKGEPKERLSDLLSRVKQAQDLSGFSALNDEIKALKESTPPQFQEIARQLSDVFELKTTMLLWEKERELRKKVQDMHLSLSELKEIEGYFKAIEEARDVREYLEALMALQRKLDAYGVDISSEIKELLEAKAYLVPEEPKEIPLPPEPAGEQPPEPQRNDVGDTFQKIGIVVAGAIKIISLLTLGIILTAVIFYCLTGRKRKRLSSLYDKSPPEFIIALYHNAREILHIFGLRYEGVIPPLLYAQMVQQKYQVKDDSFLNLTTKFEEARYSSHALESGDARLVLNTYNNFLKAVFGSCDRLRLFFLYFLTLLYRKPLYIRRHL